MRTQDLFVWHTCHLNSICMSFNKLCPTKRALDGWDAKRQCALAGRRSLDARSPNLRHFRALSTPEQNPALKVFSRPYPSAGNVNRWAANERWKALKIDE